MHGRLEVYDHPDPQAASALMVGELGYVTLGAKPLHGHYFKQIAPFIGPQTDVSLRSVPFGRRAVGARSFVLDWDCAEAELPAGARRVWIANALDHERSEPFDIAGSNAPWVLQRLSEQHRLKWSSYELNGSVIAFVDSAFMEPSAAPNEPMSRLLLSPFSDAFIQIAFDRTDLFILFDLREFGFAASRNSPVEFERADAACLAYWVESQTSHERLSALRSRSTTGQRLPKLPGLELTGATAIQIGTNLFIQSVGDKSCRLRRGVDGSVSVIHCGRWSGKSWSAQQMASGDQTSRGKVLTREAIDSVRSSLSWRTLC